MICQKCKLRLKILKDEQGDHPCPFCGFCPQGNTNTIDYVEVENVREKPVRRKGAQRLLPGQDVFGYGTKISTDKEVLYEGKWLRVYITQISNAGSAWILVNGEKKHLYDSL